MSRRNLIGATVAITGGAGGIGTEMARAFARHGALVSIGDLDAVAARHTAETLGTRSTWSQLDVSDEASFRDFLDATESELGPLDVLVNNAGVLGLSRFADESIASIRRHVDVNLIGTLLGTRTAIERMAPRGRGHVVNVASIAGVAPIPAAATYTATKHAIVGFTDAVRNEMHGSGMRFTTVLPTHVRTPMTDGIPENRMLPVVDATRVADAVVAAVITGRREVFVPGRMALLRVARALLPIPVLALATRAVGGDRQLLAAAEQAHHG